MPRHIEEKVFPKLIQLVIGNGIPKTELGGFHTD
jgi:hypothetical protein